MFKMLMQAMLLLFISVALCGTAHAQLGAPPIAAPTADVEVHQLPTTDKPISFNAEKATNAYLARISGPARTRSDSYFEGCYILLVVDTLYALAVMGLLLWFKVSARMRTFAQNFTRSRFWQVPIYFIMFFILVTVVTFPLSAYESFFREHAYGLSNQNFGQWLGDFGIEFAVTLAGATILIALLYAGIRAAKRGWWIWGAVLTIAFLTVAIMVYPVFLAPLLNHYKPLPDGPVKQEILSMARANEVPATDVYEFDASRQSDRISANVSGLFGTTRISVTDNLLKRGTPREAKAILGHEIGHYVMNHVTVNLLWLSIIYIIGFWFADRTFRFLTGLFGGNWDVRTVDDPAGLPVLYAAFTIYMFFASPFINTIIRTQEAQADMFGVNAAREPDAFATSVLKLSEYRKLDPSPLEEWVFFDHPSGRNRISMMMRWKAEHINDPDIKAGPVSPQ